MTAPAAQEPLERILDLNVGGVHYTVSRDTLLRLPNTMLEAMFSGRHQQQKHEGRYFIDRDGETFKYILAFLRDGDDWPQPSDRQLLRRIEAEARYFGIAPLLTRLERALRPVDRRDEPQAPRYFSAFIISNSTYGVDLRFASDTACPPAVANLRGHDWERNILRAVDRLTCEAAKAGYRLASTSTLASGASGAGVEKFWVTFVREDLLSGTDTTLAPPLPVPPPQPPRGATSPVPRSGSPPASLNATLSPRGHRDALSGSRTAAP